LQHGGSVETYWALPGQLPRDGKTDPTQDVREHRTEKVRQARKKGIQKKGKGGRVLSSLAKEEVVGLKHKEHQPSVQSQVQEDETNPLWI